MEDQNRNMSNVDGDQQGKYNYKNQATELKQVKAYLTEHNATATMVATALNIYRPNLTRYKTMLEMDGSLKVTHRAACKETHYQADYLTCDPRIINTLPPLENNVCTQSLSPPSIIHITSKSEFLDFNK